MVWIALKMLTGDRSKYLAIIFGITFACVLIAEQSAMFCGIMMRTTSQIRDVHDADIWVMNRDVRSIDDLKAIADTAHLRVRGVPGVAWAVPLLQRSGTASITQRDLPGSHSVRNRRCLARWRSSRADLGKNRGPATIRRGDHRRSRIPLAVAERTLGTRQNI